MFRIKIMLLLRIELLSILEVKEYSYDILENIFS